MVKPASAEGPVRTETASGNWTTSRMTLHSVIIVFVGAAAYGVLISGVLLDPGAYPLGLSIYDQYFLAIIDGHLDLPARIARLEGHYTPDGTAYLYHGVAPLLTRFAFGWVWPFEHIEMARFSIWFWACLGTVCYHIAFFKVAEPYLSKLDDTGAAISRFLGIAVWFGSPGILAAANATIYHEPISVAYAAAGGFILLTVLVWRRDITALQALLPMALCAAVALHARPNVAVGLYLGTLIAIALILRSGFRKSWLRAMFALAILGAGGMGYLGLNALKFGSATETHGSFEREDVQYGFVFWGIEDANSERAQAFNKHGKFNLRRVPHNLTLYAFDVPDFGTRLEQLGTSFREWVRQNFASSLGFIRVEPPMIGIVFLWPLWFGLAACAFLGGTTPLKQMSAPLLAGLATAVLTVSYGTVTMRYRIDIWPLVSVLALIGMHNMMPRLSLGSISSPVRSLFAVLFLFGTLTSTFMAVRYQNLHTNSRYSPAWSLELCQSLANKKGFSDEDTDRICRPPRSGL